MALNFLASSELSQRNVSIMDASSASELASMQICSILTTPLGDWLEPAALARAVERAIAQGYNQVLRSSDAISEAEYQLATALSLLERLCINDTVAIDRRSLSSLSPPEYDLTRLENYSDLVCLTDISDDHYRRVGKRLQGYSAALSEMGIDSLVERDHGRFLGDSPDKEFQENLRVYNVPAELESSGYSLARTLFYLDVGDSLGCPVFLSSRKARWADRLDLELREDAFSVVERIFETALVDKARARLNEIYSVSFEAPAPPLLRLIARSAIDNRQSLLDAVREIRASQENVRFRDLIFKIQSSLKGDAQQLLEVERLLTRLETVAESWYEHGVMKSKIKLSSIPAIGWVFELAGRESFTVQDFVLFGSRRYLTFLSSWYAP